MAINYLLTVMILQVSKLSTVHPRWDVQPSAPRAWHWHENWMASDGRSLQLKWNMLRVLCFQWVIWLVLNPPPCGTSFAYQKGKWSSGAHLLITSSTTGQLELFFFWGFPSLKPNSNCPWTWAVTPKGNFIPQRLICRGRALGFIRRVFNLKKKPWISDWKAPK